MLDGVLEHTFFKVSGNESHLYCSLDKETILGGGGFNTSSYSVREAIAPLDTLIMLTMTMRPSIEKEIWQNQKVIISPKSERPCPPKVV